MKALLLATALLLCLALTSAQKQTLSPKRDICRLLKDGTKLRQPGFCDRQIECVDSKSVPTSVVCDGTTPFINRNTLKCAKTVTDKYCKAPCTSKSNRYIKDTKNCQGWYQCSGATELNHGTCISNLVFDPKEQFCKYPEDVACEATFTLCDVVPDNIKIMDEGNCHKYYICETTGSVKKTTKLYSRLCPTGRYFDVKTGDCIEKAMVDCYKHPYPDDVCGNSKIAIRGRFVKDGATCRGYFYCQDKGTGVPDTAPAWGQCGATLFFSEKENACLPRAHIKCEEDRCDGRGNGLALSETRGCQHYLECENDHTVDELQCPGNQYFDAEKFECTSVRKSYPACS